MFNMQDIMYKRRNSEITENNYSLVSGNLQKNSEIVLKDLFIQDSSLAQVTTLSNSVVLLTRDKQAVSFPKVFVGTAAVLHRLH